MAVRIEHKSSASRRRPTVTNVEQRWHAELFIAFRAALYRGDGWTVTGDRDGFAATKDGRREVFIITEEGS